MKKLLILLAFIFPFLSLTAQIEKPPVYPGCENEAIQNLEICFNSKLKETIIANFQVPQTVLDENYNGIVKVVFLVNKNGNFDVLYVNAMYPELEEEAKRLFRNLPTIEPATYNGRAIDSRYVIPISIPLNSNQISTPVVVQNDINSTVKEKVDIQQETETTVQNDDTSLFPEFQSELNIPLSHQSYDNILYYLNKAENTHSTSKPFIYSEVKPYVDLESQRTALLKDKTSWGGRKLFNEHLALIKGENYWFTLNPVFDFQIGKDNSDNVDYTYNNTRGVQIQGSLGKKFSFNTSFYESQGRFADYVNRSTRDYSVIGASAVVPGRGKAKSFKEGGFDYPVAEAYLSFTPNEFFNIQFGNGKNFIGDGYRSFFLSDVATSYPFLKISTQFWKIKYTNLWMWMDDVRKEASDDNTNLKKFVAMHHLSWNVTKKFNIGLFESVITNENNYNQFDISFFNPIIFYRAVEFSNGGDLTGNVQIGLNMKYKINDNLYIYDQFLIDEMTVDEVFAGNGYWGNKFAFQLGAKYFNAFKIDNLMLQGEFNWTRPYTFSHGVVELNSGHYNQPISHLWGGNFWEAIAIARYQKNRWFANAKIIIGEKGLDYDGSSISYGGDIYRSYNDRPSDYNNEVAQGNTTSIFIGDLQAGYVLNPVTNLQVFGGFTYRSYDPSQAVSSNPLKSTTWFSVGLKSDLFNWYFDF